MRAQVLDLAAALMNRLAYQSANANNVQITSKVVNIRGNKIFYQDAGRGRPVVLLHGLGASSMNWIFAIPALARNYRVIALDQIGHGRSDKPLISYRITDFVDYLESFLAELQLGEIDLIGNSLGGWIAARLAVRRPDLVGKLALVCSAGLQPSPAMRAHLEKIKFAPRTLADTREILSICFYNKVRYVNSVSVTLSYILRHLEDNFNTVERVVEAALDPDEWLDDKLDRLQARTLVMWGLHDELLPVEFAHRFIDAIPGAQLKILEQCGHVPHIERARDFNQLIADFLG